jgi:hypothetical protein
MVHFFNSEYEPYTPSESILSQEIPAEAEENAVVDEATWELSVENVEETPLPHPFTTTIDCVPGLATTSIIGQWVFHKFTESYQLNGTETETPFVYIDWLFPALQVFDDKSFHIVIYGTIEGTLIQIAQDEYLLVNLIATSEGEIWHPDDSNWLRYFPKTGLLRYSFFNEFSNKYIHYYFIRK